MNPLILKVTSKSDGSNNLARCNGKVASCTSSAEAAVRNAADKAAEWFRQAPHLNAVRPKQDFVLKETRLTPFHSEWSVIIGREL